MTAIILHTSFNKRIITNSAEVEELLANTHDDIIYHLSKKSPEKQGEIIANLLNARRKDAFATIFNNPQ